MKRILLLTVGMRLGGAERTVASIAQGLEGEYEFHVGYFKNHGPVAEELRRSGVEVFRVPMASWWDPTAAWRLAREIRRRGLGLVHTHIARADVLGVAAARMVGSPCLVTRHSCFEPWQNRASLRRLYRQALRRASQLVAVSRATRDFLICWGRCAPERIMVSGGLPLELTPRGGAGEADVRSERQFPMIGALGRLDRCKGLDLLLRAVLLLLGDFPGLRCSLKGEGPERGALQRLSRRLGLADRLSFHPAGLEVSSYLEQLDCVVVPSRHEGLGLTALQAMALERPVVAAGVEGLREVILDGVTGWLTDPEEPGALAEGVRKVLEDRAAAGRMARRGRERLEARYLPSKWLRQHGELYARYL